MLLQNRFKNAVKFLQNVLCCTPTIEILRYVKIKQTKERIQYYATNLETFLTLDLPIWGETEAEFLIDGEVLKTIDEPIATSYSDDKAKFNNLTIATVNTNEFPEFPKLSKPIWSAVLDRNYLIRTGKRISSYTCKDDYREALRMICLRPEFFWATDGHIMIKESHAIKINSNDDILIPPLFIKYLSAPFILDDDVEISVYHVEEQREKGKVVKTYLKATGMGYCIIMCIPTVEYPMIESILPKKFAFTIKSDISTMYSKLLDAGKFTMNQGNNMVHLSLDKTMKYLEMKVTNTEKGLEYEDKIPVSTKNKKRWNGISINAKLFSMILSDSSGKSFEIKANDNPLSAVGIKPDNGNQFFIIMPLRSEAHNDEQEKGENDAG